MAITNSAQIDDPEIGPPLEIRRCNDFTPLESEMVARADLIGPHEFEAWTVTGSNRDVGYSTHSIFRYFGKFPPPIAGHLIRLHTTTGDLVRDPTCGSGTTGVEALLHDRSCDLSDVNPLCVLISSVKTHHLDRDLLLERLSFFKEHYRPVSNDDRFPLDPVGLRNVDHWFLPETIDSLRGLRRLIESEATSAISDFFRVVFASTVRRVSRATTQQGRQFLDVDTALMDAWPVFEKNARRAVDAVSSLPRLAPVSVAERDGRSTQCQDQSAALTILHPPYFNAYRYSSINSFEMAWLGFPPSDTRRYEIREAFKTASIDKVPAYLEDIERLLESAARGTTLGGTVALMIGDTVLRGQYLPIVHSVIERLPRNLVLSKVALRVPRHTEAAWVTSQRRSGKDIGVKLYDFVLTFRVDN